MSKQQAVLDTSFWSAAVHLGVDPYLPLFFDMPLLIPGAVIREIERHGFSTPRLREDQQRFRLLMEDRRGIQADPSAAYPRFGAGEAACLALARERGAILLVNEAPAYNEAQRIGLRAVTVPEIVVRLVREGHISPNRGHSLLDLLSHTTSEKLLDVAHRYIDAEGGARS